MSRSLRRIAAVPVSLLLGVAAYYFFAWANHDAQSAEIMGVGVFVVSMIAFFYGMRRPTFGHRSPR